MISGTPQFPLFVRSFERLVQLTYDAQIVSQQDTEKQLDDSRFQDQLTKIYDLLGRISDKIFLAVDALIKFDGDKLTKLRENRGFKKLSDPLFESLEGALTRLKEANLQDREVSKQTEAIVSKFTPYESPVELDHRSRWEINQDLQTVVSILLQPSLRKLILDSESSEISLANACDYGTFLVRLDPEITRDIIGRVPEKLIKSTTENGARKLTNLITALYAFRLIPNEYADFIDSVILNEHEHDDYGPIQSALIAYALLDRRQEYDSKLVGKLVDLLEMQDEPSIAIRSLLALTNQELPQDAFSENANLFPALTRIIEEDQPFSVEAFDSPDEARHWTEALKHHAAKVLAVADLNMEQFDKLLDLLDSESSRASVEMILSRFLRKTLAANNEEYFNKLVFNVIYDGNLTADKYHSFALIVQSLEDLKAFYLDRCFDSLQFKNEQERRIAQDSSQELDLRTLISDDGELLPMFDDHDAKALGVDLDMKLDSVTNCIKALEFMSRCEHVDFSFPPANLLRHHLASYGTRALKEILDYFSEKSNPMAAKRLLAKTLEAIFSTDQEYLMNQINLNCEIEDLESHLPFNRRRFLAPEIQTQEVEDCTRKLLDLYDKTNQEELKDLIETLLINKTPMILPILINYGIERESELALKILRQI